MKNIADVNSDDILTELNSLDYDVDDLQLLDDEDIKPINNGLEDPDFSNFYEGLDDSLEQTKVVETIDMFTEQVKVPEEKIENVAVQKQQEKKENDIVESPFKSETKRIDDYLNRQNVQEGINKPVQEKQVVDTPSLVQAVEPVQTVKPQSESVPLTSYAANKAIQREAHEIAQTRNLSQLFNKVSNNVKGASEIVNKNAEIKKKIDDKFNELKRLQDEHEANKKKDYEEINAYKDEVYAKLQQKKSDMEKDLIELRAEQEKLANDRKDFENYKATTLENLKKAEKEMNDSYSSRTKDIEQVEVGLVKRKEQLDKERAELAKERENIVKEREELTTNLLQFNKLVDDFTSGINNFS